MILSEVLSSLCCCQGALEGKHYFSVTKLLARCRASDFNLRQSLAQAAWAGWMVTSELQAVVGLWQDEKT